MMLEPDPKLRATAQALLALPMLRQPRPWSVLWYMAAEALSRGWALWQVSLARVRLLPCSLDLGSAQPSLIPCPHRPFLPCYVGSGMGWLILPVGCSPRARRPPHLAHHPAASSWTAATPATGKMTA